MSPPSYMSPTYTWRSRLLLSSCCVLLSSLSLVCGQVDSFSSSVDLDPSTQALLKSVRPVNAATNCGLPLRGWLLIATPELTVTAKDPVSSNTFAILKSSEKKKTDSKVRTAKACKQECENTDTCSGYTFFLADQGRETECHLKRGVQKRKIAFGFRGLDVVSGVVCSAKSEMDLKGQTCSDWDMDSDADGVPDCIDVCQGRSDPGRDLNGDGVYDEGDCMCPMHLRGDADGDGIADCFDLAGYVPAPPVVTKPGSIPTTGSSEGAEGSRDVNEKEPVVPVVPVTEKKVPTTTTAAPTKVKVVTTPPPPTTEKKVVKVTTPAPPPLQT